MPKVTVKVRSALSTISVASPVTTKGLSRSPVTTKGLSRSAVTTKNLSRSPVTTKGLSRSPAIDVDQATCTAHGHTVSSTIHIQCAQSSEVYRHLFGTTGPRSHYSHSIFTIRGNGAAGQDRDCNVTSFKLSNTKQDRDCIMHGRPAERIRQVLS